MVGDPDLVQPLEDPLADLGMAQPVHGAADPEGVARPAIGAQAAIEARGDRAVLGVGVQRGRQGRAPQADGVGGPREMEVGDRLDELVPLAGPWTARPGRGRSAASGTRSEPAAASARTCPGRRSSR